MKSLLKILTPTVSTIGIATISLTSCGTISADGYTAIPTDLLKIENSQLLGFNDDYTPIATYNKITVPKDVEAVKLIYGSHKFAYDCVKKIDYESGSNWETVFNIHYLNNLEYLVLPPKLTNINEWAISECKNLRTIDISNVEDITCLTNVEWIENNFGVYDSGTLIVKHNQLDKVKAIKDKNPFIVNFEIKEK